MGFRKSFEWKSSVLDMQRIIRNKLLILLMNKVIFDASLSKKNIAYRDFLLTKIKKYRNPASSIALEIGIGNGRFVILLADKFKEYWGIDPDEKYIHIAQENTSKFTSVHLRLGKAESIPLKKKFDVILFINSWHFTDNEKALIEVKKSIKENGIVLISEPTENSKFAASTLQKGHPDFDEKKFNFKLKKLKKAANFLKEQKDFVIVEEEIYYGNNNLCWVLRPK